ncbi:peptidylprolyl isomerase domain and WD repeat-containing protein 1-like protein, partial [Leptotrombidium deliense]
MSEKRKLDDSQSKSENQQQIISAGDGCDVNVVVSDDSSKKRVKSVEYEHLFIKNLPSSEAYEKSYMHRDVVYRIVVTSKTDFIITSSVDGCIKFWKKAAYGIEFVKHFRAHVGNIQHICCNSTGTLLATISNDKTVKVFDIINFDMINMIKLNFTPGKCEWIHSAGDPISALAVSDLKSSFIYIFDGKGDGSPMNIIEKLHSVPVSILKYNHVFSTMVSVDTNGMLEYWSSPENDYKFPQSVVDFQYKIETDLFEFVKTKTTPFDLSFSEDGLLFASISSDRKIRIFKFLTGKIVRVFDEGLQQLQATQQVKQVLSNVEFARRMAVEKELEKSDAFSYQTIKFDSSGYFV